MSKANMSRTKSLWLSISTVNFPFRTHSSPPVLWCVFLNDVFFPILSLRSMSIRSSRGLELLSYGRRGKIDIQHKTKSILSRAKRSLQSLATLCVWGWVCVYICKVHNTSLTNLVRVCACIVHVFVHFLRVLNACILNRYAGFFFGGISSTWLKSCVKRLCGMPKWNNRMRCIHF